MAAPRLSKLEFQIMETLWGSGDSGRGLSIRGIVDAFPVKRKPAYTTIQTTMYRMEAKGVVRRVKKVGNFHLFAAAISRDAAQRRLIDELLALFGGRPQPVMAHLVETGKLTLEDVKDAAKLVRELSGKIGAEGQREQGNKSRRRGQTNDSE
jgi:BlaI family transcriptional regulator, penicillinase repressor